MVAVTSVSGHLVVLRPISREDYPTIFQWRSSFDTIHALNFRRKISSYEEFIRDFETFLPSAILLVVETKTTRQRIGFALAHNLDQWNGHMSVALFVEEAFRRRGHAGEAALLCIDGLFRLFPIRKIYTEAYAFSEDAYRLLSALGFSEAGRMKEHYWYETQFWDLILMELTRDDWKQRREQIADLISIQHSYVRSQAPIVSAR